MRKRLLFLLERWAIAELARINGRGLTIPDAGYLWIKDKLGHWHHGSYDGRYRFIPLQPSFNLERGTSVREHSDVDEFGFAFRELSESEQALIIIGHFGNQEDWEGWLRENRISKRQSVAMFRRTWGRLTVECRKRGLL